jgi:hypothetical protein
MNGLLFIRQAHQQPVRYAKTRTQKICQFIPDYYKKATGIYYCRPIRISDREGFSRGLDTYNQFAQALVEFNHSKRTDQIVF